MSRIELDHWFINGNELSISLMRYYVSIEMVKDDENITFLLNISTGSGGEKIVLPFKEIEDAIVFTENIVRFSDNFDEIRRIYYDTLYDQKRYVKWRYDYGSKK